MVFQGCKDLPIFFLFTFSAEEKTAVFLSEIIVINPRKTRKGGSHLSETVA